MSIYLVFTENNCKIYKDPKNVPANSFFVKSSTLLPKCPPHFWKIKDNKVVEMTRPEKMLRLSNHSLMGINNSIDLKETRFKKLKRQFKNIIKNKYKLFLAFIAGMGAAHLWQLFN